MTSQLEQEERERFARGQEALLDGAFLFMPDEQYERRRFTQLAMDTFDALAMTRFRPNAPYAISPKSGYSLCRQASALFNLSPTLRDRWTLCARDYEALAQRNPKLELFDLMAAIGHDQNGWRWPYGREESIREWAAARNREPAPLEKRRLDLAAIHQRLHELNSILDGWLYWNGATGKFVFEEDFVEN